MPLRLSLAVALAMIIAAPAAAGTYLPPRGKIFAGVTAGNGIDRYQRQVGRHPPVFAPYAKWNEPVDWMFGRAHHSRARLMISVSTARTGPGKISPRDIARGYGDTFLAALNRAMAKSGLPTYIDLLAEMNSHWNPYCAFDGKGHSRGPAYSTAVFRQAFRRAVVILRGGSRNGVDARLRRLHLRPVRGVDGPLGRPRVAIMWAPQVFGGPDTRANGPHAYWPGGAYVDWVGTDFFSKFANFTRLTRLYKAYNHKPFFFGEWGIWSRDNPAYVHRLFRWIAANRRTRMLFYFQGNKPGSQFDLDKFPRSRRTIRSFLRRRQFATYAPEFGR